MRTQTPSTDLRTRRPRGVIAVFAAALVAVGVLAVPAAHATPEQQTYSISGTLFIGSPPTLVLPAGSTFTATFDPATGAITNGHVSIPTFPRGAVPEADITITDAIPATGTLDPATGVATLVSSYNISLSVPLLGAVCNLPVTVTMATANPGGSPITGNPPTGTVTAAGFPVSGVDVGPTCPAGTDAQVNTALGLPTTNTSMTLTVSLLPPTPIVATPAFTG